MKKNNILLKNLSSIDWNLIIKVILWGILCLSLFYFVIYLMGEKNYYSDLRHDDPITISGVIYYSITDVRKAIGNGTIVTGADLAQAYNKLIEWTEYPHFFPVIGFSLLWFIPGTNKISATTLPLDGWNARWNGITLAYSYFFITIMIALVGMAMLLINGVKDIHINRMNKKMHVTPYPIKNYSYAGFTMKNVTEFVLNLTLVFAFFNFLSTCVVIGYWLFLIIIKNIIKLATRNKFKLATDEFEVNKSDLYYLIGVMIFQNTYTIVKSYFMNGFGVNLDIIMQIIIPIGTVTVIIGLFIKNMMSSKLNATKNKIKNIGDSVNKIRMFVTLQGTKAFDDYDFLNLLPSFLKEKIIDGQVDKKALLNSLIEYEKISRFIEDNYKKKDMDKKYLLYVMNNVCKSKDDLDIFYTNLKNIKQYKISKGR
ncbi:MAG: hypothetical protein LBQ45_00415 [Mycoplasmataceae bacterium]|nr:hypothetical protein [Mycoplasmataceae bacterium]